MSIQYAIYYKRKKIKDGTSTACIAQGPHDCKEFKNKDGYRIKGGICKNNSFETRNAESIADIIPTYLEILRASSFKKFVARGVKFVPEKKNDTYDFSNLYFSFPCSFTYKQMQVAVTLFRDIWEYPNRVKEVVRLWNENNIGLTADACLFIGWFTTVEYIHHTFVERRMFPSCFGLLKRGVLKKCIDNLALDTENRYNDRASARFKHETKNVNFARLSLEQKFKFLKGENYE